MTHVALIGFGEAGQFFAAGAGGRAHAFDLRGEARAAAPASGHHRVLGDRGRSPSRLEAKLDQLFGGPCEAAA